MSPEFATALPFILIGLVLLLIVIWLVARSNRKTTVIDDESTGPDAEKLEEGGGKPTRNQALIDSPKATEIVYGQTSANANSDTIATAGEDADAEAGVTVAPTVGDPVPPRPHEQPQTLTEASDTQTAPHPEAREGERTRPSPPATPAKPPEPASPPASDNADGDDLTRIKGLGPKLAAMLRDERITRFDQIAGWDDADIDRIDAKLGRFSGRIRRDQWVEQARLLQSGDQEAFDATFGRNR